MFPYHNSPEQCQWLFDVSIVPSHTGWTNLNEPILNDFDPYIYIYINVYVYVYVYDIIIKTVVDKHKTCTLA